MGETGLAALNTALQNAFATETMLGNLTTLIGALGALIIFAFTYRLVRRMVSGAKKGSAKI